MIADDAAGDVDGDAAGVAGAEPGAAQADGAGGAGKLITPSGQSVKALGGSANTISVGRVSVNAMPVTGVIDPELSMSKDSVVVLPGPMASRPVPAPTEPGSKIFVNVGWA